SRSTRQRRRSHGTPMIRADLHPRGLGLEDLAGRHYINRPARIAVRDLKGTVHDLLRIRAEADLVIVVHVATHDTALVGDVLEPLDELVAAPAQLTLLRRG